MICFRVTRSCNARCGFCLAPPDGVYPEAETLIHRIDWLLSRGVKAIHFCGGEPTIHPALPQLLTHVHARGCATRLTTNAIAIPDSLPALLRIAGTRVKVSLHGDRGHHDAIVGQGTFDQTSHNLRRLLAAGGLLIDKLTGKSIFSAWCAVFIHETLFSRQISHRRTCLCM